MCLTSTVTVLSGAMRTKALGANGACAAPSPWITAAAPDWARANLGTCTPINSPTPATAVLFKKSRRDQASSSVEYIGSSLQGRRSVVDRLSDAHIGRAAADVPIHRVIDIRVARFRNLGEQRDGAHHLAGLTIPALRHVKGDPRALHRLRHRAGNTFDGCDLGPFDGRNRRSTGAPWLTVNMHGAGATLRDSAAELGAREPKLIAQHPQQRGVGFYIDLVPVSYTHLTLPTIY